MVKKSVESLPIEGKKVLVRVDFNVPLDANGGVSDDTRLVATLPTLEYLRSRKACTILCSHLGRPKGKKEPKYSLAPVAKQLEKLLGGKVKFVPDCIGDSVKEQAKNLKPGEFLLLENLRYYPGEEKNDGAFAKSLADLADCFVQDAFGAVHRAHASTASVPKLLPSAAGFLLSKELKFLGTLLSGYDKPFAAVIGGAKVSDKIEVLESLLQRVDVLLIGGAMAYTFMAARGIPTGRSKVELEQVDVAKKILNQAQVRKVKVEMPVDHVVTKAIEDTGSAYNTEDVNIPDEWIGVDIGPRTIEKFREALDGAKTIFWNGPVGIFEVERYAKGNLALAMMVAEATAKGATTVVGGGDSVAAVKAVNVADKISHISTGGGASLEFLEGKSLPGVEVLPDA